MVWLKLKAGALQLTLFIAVVIAIILASFILLVHTHKRFNVNTDFIIETTRNLNKGINQSLINAVPLNDTVNVILDEDLDYKSLKLHREFWGIFEKVTSKAIIKNNILKRVALIGGIQQINNRTALYVQDNNKPLVVVGNTKINGTAYLPYRGVKSGTISGESYYGSQLIYGMTKKSSMLPSLFNETVAQLGLIDKKYSNIEYNQFLTLINGKIYTNSFLDPKQVVFSNSIIRLSDINLVGNIVIQSNSKIIVEASSNLKDVILIAPEIEIKDQVKGNFQAIASKNINVGKRVILEYPSAIVLNEKETVQSNTLLSDPNQNKIFIDNHTSIAGVVIYISKPKINNYKPQIELTETAIVKGEVYCTENVELKGIVYGSVYTNNFIATQFGSIYQNHIYNGTIIVDNLEEKYVGITFNNSKKGVLKWLY